MVETNKSPTAKKSNGSKKSYKTRKPSSNCRTATNKAGFQGSTAAAKAARATGERTELPIPRIGVPVDQGSPFHTKNLTL